MKKKTSPPAVTAEDVAHFPLPGFTMPVHLAFSPDDRAISYLFSPERTLSRQLFILDLKSGETGQMVMPDDGGETEEKMSLDEKLLRERRRQLGLGVTQYAWASGADRLLVPVHGKLLVGDGPDTPLRELLKDETSPFLDPRLSPDGNWVAYVQDAELWVVPVAGGEARQLTSGASENGLTHGLAEFVAAEEMDRDHGFWWSNDSRWLAFAEVDERHIPVYRIVHQGKDDVGEGAQEEHHYPFAGQANARVRLGVIPASGGEPVWMDLGQSEDIYLARVQWLPDGGLSAQLQNREQSVLDLVRFDPLSGRRTTLLRETSDKWINLHNMFKSLEAAGRAYEGGFIWASERTGFRHLYLYDSGGSLLRPLTEGEWMVDEVVGIDEDQEQLYFTGSRDGPTERQLYSVSLSSGEMRRISAGAGMHSVVIDRGRKRYIDTYDSLDRPPAVSVRSLASGERLDTIYEGADSRADSRIERFGLEPPEIVSLQNRDGITLYGAIYRPAPSFGPGPYPAVVSVYGGPHVQFVTNSWLLTADMRAQHLRNLGFLVFKLDNRGSARRGVDFETAIKHDMGNLEVQDQVDGVRLLVEQGLADPGRVGIYGGSYGGYMSVMCLARAPETFKVAVANAPVTHWDGYDTHYTERYMGTPDSNARGYVEGSASSHVENIKGRLLLIHGLLDENVHFRHTVRLINALMQAGVPYDMLLVPEGRHSTRKKSDRAYVAQRTADYFLQHL
jgi:dipeptidyl-peptidase-4